MLAVLVVCWPWPLLLGAARSRRSGCEAIAICAICGLVIAMIWYARGGKADGWNQEVLSGESAARLCLGFFRGRFVTGFLMYSQGDDDVVGFVVDK